MPVGDFIKTAKPIIITLLYFAWIYGVDNWFAPGRAAYPQSCGAANGMLVILTMLLTGALTIHFSMLAVFTQGVKRYITTGILLVVYLPVCAFMGWQFLFI